MFKKPAIIASLIGIGVFALLNHAIYAKETLLSGGENMLLELAPVDPRSLMQGDYMVLRYEAGIGQKTPENRRAGWAVLEADADGVARFLRFDDGTPLTKKQIRLRYHKSGGSISLRPASFLFQEGHGKAYEAARYGIFTHDGKGNALLTGLADGEKKPINPKN